MTQLTVRGFDEQLERRLRALAQTEGVSLNKAALLLMRRGAGLGTRSDRPHVIGNALNDFIGVWSAEDEREFLASVEDFERIDDSFWSE